MLGTRRDPQVRLLVDGTYVPIYLNPQTGEFDFRADKIKPFSDVTPADQKYENLPVYRERPYEWSLFAGGFGHVMQVQDPADKDGFYGYTLGLDASVQGQVILGPAMTSVTPATTGAAVRLVEFKGVIYLLASRYALVRGGDSASQWTVSHDFGAGKAATEGLVVSQDVSGGTPYLAVAMGQKNAAGADKMYRFDGTSWTQFSNLYAGSFALLGFELFRHSLDNFVTKVDIRSDWTTEANWASDTLFPIGSNAYAVTELVSTPTDTLFVVKQDNIYSIDADGFTLDLYGSMRSSPSANNGLGWAWWATNVYIPTPNAGLVELEPIRGIGGIIGTKYNQMGPELLAENNTPAKGIVTAVEGTKFALYAMLWDPDANASYLIKYGGRSEAGELIKDWHGSLSAAFTGKKGTTMLRSSVGAPANHERMYIGFDDGSVAWFTLSCQANPVACSHYQYTLTGTMNLPLNPLGYASNVKAQRGWSTWGKFFDSTHFAQIQSRGDTSQSYTDTGARFTAAAGQRNDFATPISGRLCDAQVTLTSINDPTTTPQLTTVACHYNIVPDYLQEFSGTVDARAYPLLRDGRIARQSPEQIKDVMKNAAANVSSTWTTPHDETQRTVVVYEHAEVPVMSTQHQRGGYLIPFKAVEYKTEAVNGTWADWNPEPWSVLSDLTWAQRGVL